MRDSVLVTGGAGFVGSELVAQLVNAGRHVLVLDNLATGRRENLAGLDPQSVEFIHGDIRDSALLADLLPRVHTVFHLACLGVRHSLRAPRENHDVNATGTLTLLEAARAAGVGRFVHVSTSEVYGPAQRAPMAEDHPLEPATVYGASKLAGEAYARAAFLTWGFPVVIVRPFNAFGPRSHHEGECGEVIPRFLLRALAGRPVVVFGDGGQTRDFTFVEDTARGVRLAGEGDAALGGTFNLGSGRELRIGELPAMIAHASGIAVPPIQYQAPRPGDVRRLVADAARAHSVLGFAPRVSFEEGVDRLVAWVRAQGLSPEALLEQESVRSWES
jgi:UDP-glucose 4-epimerase